MAATSLTVQAFVKDTPQKYTGEVLVADMALTMSNSSDIILEVYNDGTAGVKATGTVTSSGTNVTADDTVTINGKAYKFVASPTTEGDVDIGTTAAVTLDNLKAAITHTGTAGTDYVCAAAHPTVTATTNADTVQTLEAITEGTAGNALTLAKSAATLTVSDTVLAGGVDDVPIVVTLVGEGVCEYGATHDLVQSIPGKETWIFPPLTVSRFQDETAKTVEITTTGTLTNCTIKAMKLR